MNTVRIPKRCRTSRTSPTKLWKKGAWKNANPFFSKLSNCFIKLLSIAIPSSPNTSVLPLWLVTDLLPCLATFTPKAATIKATVVEMLIVLSPSPPVPQRSIIGLGSAKVVLYAKMLRTKAVSDSGYKLFSLISTKSAPNCTMSYCLLCNISHICLKSLSPNG